MADESRIMAGDLEELRKRDDRIYAWLRNIKPGDIVTVRLNETDTLTGKVYEAPDSSGRTALYVNTTLLRHDNGYPGAAFEPVVEETKEMPVRMINSARLRYVSLDPEPNAFGYGIEVSDDGG